MASRTWEVVWSSWDCCYLFLGRSYNGRWYLILNHNQAKVLFMNMFCDLRLQLIQKSCLVMVDYCNVLLRKTKSKTHILIGQNRTLSYSRKCWVTFVCSSSWVEAQQLPRHHLRPLVCKNILFSGMWKNDFFWFDTVPLKFSKEGIKSSLQIFMFQYIASAPDFWTKSRSWSRHSGRSQGPGPMT